MTYRVGARGCVAVQLLEPTAWRRAQRRSQSSSVVRPPRPLPPLKVGATLWVEGADYQTVKGPSPVDAFQGDLVVASSPPGRRLGGRAAEDSRRTAEDSRRATDELCERRCARRLPKP